MIPLVDFKIMVNILTDWMLWLCSSNIQCSFAVNEYNKEQKCFKASSKQVVMFFIIFFVLMICMLIDSALFEQQALCAWIACYWAESLVLATTRRFQRPWDLLDLHGASSSWGWCELRSTRKLSSEGAKTSPPIISRFHRNSPVHVLGSRGLVVYQLERTLKHLVVYPGYMVLSLLKSDGDWFRESEFTVACGTRAFREHRSEFGQLVLLDNRLLLIHFDDSPVKVLEEEPVLLYNSFW